MHSIRIVICKRCRPLARTMPHSSCRPVPRSMPRKGSTLGVSGPSSLGLYRSSSELGIAQCTMLIHSADWHGSHGTRPDACKAGSAKSVGNVRVQLFVATEVVLRPETTCGRQPLLPHEESLRQLLKLKSLALSSLQCTIAR
jgi:hypothetical protein